MQLFSKWCEKAWLYVVYFLAFLMLLRLVIHWQSWTIPQFLIGLLVVSIPMHIFEENTYPGGFFYMNNLTFGSKNPMMYPQNRATNMVTNLGAEIVFILLALNALKMEAVVVHFLISIAPAGHLRNLVVSQSSFYCGRNRCWHWHICGHCRLSDSDSVCNIDSSKKRRIFV